MSDTCFSRPANTPTNNRTDQRQQTDETPRNTDNSFPATRDEASQAAAHSVREGRRGLDSGRNAGEEESGSAPPPAPRGMQEAPQNPEEGPHREEPSQRANSNNPPDGEEPNSTLKFVSANVQKSALNHGVLLENNRDADIVFVQEPYKGFIKKIVSTEKPDGEEYCHTTAHRNFLCLGYSRKTRVLVYVNKRWREASPRVRTTLVKHDDVLCVSMRVDGTEMTFLNVYNDSHSFAGVTYLLERAPQLPKISIMAGDFNLRDPLWDAGERQYGVVQRHRNRRDELFELAVEHLNLQIANDPNGPPTWMSNNLEARDGVLDLVWVDPEKGTLGGVFVDSKNRVRSDHAVLKWEVPVDDYPTGRPTIQRGSEEGDEYIKSCRSLLRALPTEYTSKEHVEGIGNWLGAKLEELWNRYATVPKRCKHSKSWWSRECSARMKEVRLLRLARKDLVKERKRWQTGAIRQDEQPNR